MNEEMICPICGNPTSQCMGNYRKDKLCRYHAQLLKKGDIVQNDMGIFIDSKNFDILNYDAFVKLENDFKCISCGKTVIEGYYFCKDCYDKYKNKTIKIEFTRCKNPKVIDEDYPAEFLTKDGHLVRSTHEKIISDYLFDNDYKYIYEKQVHINKNEFIKPDFCLPNYNNSKEDVYIEYLGIERNDNNDKEYKKYKKILDYKLEIYKNKKFTVLFLYPIDIHNINYSLTKKLDDIEYGKLNCYKEL